MKKYFFLLLTIGLLASCSKDDENTANNTETEITGTWKLVEILADPGGGSGTFEPVDSEKTITFNEDGTVTSNGDMCTLSQEADNATAGTYSLEDSTFTSPDCHVSDFSHTFEQNANILIINIPCIEPCRAKYVRKSIIH